MKTASIVSCAKVLCSCDKIISKNVNSEWWTDMIKRLKMNRGAFSNLLKQMMRLKKKKSMKTCK